MSRRLDGVSNETAVCQAARVRAEAPVWPAPEQGEAWA
jgi:hypothetical protein